VIAPLGIAPSDDVAFILQAAGLGALIGTALSVRMRVRGSRGDPAPPPMMWALAGALTGAFVVLGTGLHWW
jgi:hypothetical protein